MSENKPSVLITGANGFVGARLCRTFLGEGFEVIAGVRQTSNLSQIEGLEISYRYGDVNEPESLAAIVGGVEAWKVADEIAASGIPVLLNPMVNLPGNFDQLGARLDNAALLHEAGVSIAFTGAGTHNARKQRQAAGNAVANGLPWETALAALTATPAAILGLENGFASIEPGSPADLVLWSGDPLEVTTAADQVIIAGKAIDMVSRQTLLRDRYLEPDPALPRAYTNP